MRQQYADTPSPNWYLFTKGLSEPFAFSSARSQRRRLGSAIEERLHAKLERDPQYLRPQVDARVEEIVNSKSLHEFLNGEETHLAQNGGQVIRHDLRAEVSRVVCNEWRENMLQTGKDMYGYGRGITWTLSALGFGHAIHRYGETGNPSELLAVAGVYLASNLLAFARQKWRVQRDLAAMRGSDPIDTSALL